MARLLISLWKVQVKQMHIELTVKRQTVPDETSYLQTFSYDGDAALTIADWLTEVNRTEAKTNRIAWECGCLKKNGELVPCESMGFHGLRAVYF